MDIRTSCGSTGNSTTATSIGGPWISSLRNFVGQPEGRRPSSLGTLMKTRERRFLRWMARLEILDTLQVPPIGDNKLALSEQHMLVGRLQSWMGHAESTARQALGRTYGWSPLLCCELIERVVGSVIQLREPRGDGGWRGGGDSLGLRRQMR
uniref:Uncharacterized protein n=1 Tax=Triticum urartu TaxID=4572 RepID=A0A8R7TSY8_TRIUA